ncbi:MAG TPA: hypothetical protein VFC70_02615 [Oscillospiraceae bacterium]|nr:hypothetical protein [Oscillospiraceae bacterium]
MSDELTPIIFIPGLMGSMGGEVLGCKSKWGFGVAAWIYKPFINQLENLGYTSDEDLFVCYYDWRKSCKEIVEKFLLPLLSRIGKKYPNQKIDLLCHSMGGLVGRTYIQDKAYGYNIRNLMILGTPNKGSVKAYYTWSMGEVMGGKIDKGNQLFEIIQRGYIWLLTKILNIPLGKENIERLHENFQGLGDLLPTYDYGYVLCYEDGKNNYVYIPNKHIKYKNSFVNNLNKNIDVLYDRIKNLYCFVGTNRKTDKTLIIDIEELFNNKNEDIISLLKTNEGDGTVIVKSAIIDHGKTFIMEEGHSGILLGSIQYIADIYNLDKTLVRKDTIELEGYPLGIIFKKHVGMVLKSEKDIIGRFIHMGFVTEHEFIMEEFGEDYIWIMLKDVPSDKYVLEVFAEEEIGYDIFVIGTKVAEELTDENVRRLDKNKIEFYFEV